MARKDYVAIANVIRSTRINTLNDTARTTNNVLDDVAVGLAKYLKTENNRFDVQRFLDAAGVVPTSTWIGEKS